MTELGNVLKAAREANGLSLDDLQQLTKIQKRYLVGIENGDYGMMPGKFYVRAFIKQYAEAVGLDPESLFEQYKDEVPSVREEEVPEQLSRVQSKKTMSAPQSKLLEALPKILLVAFILGILVFGYLFFSKVYSPKEESNSSNSGTEIKLEENAVSPSQKETTDEKSAEEDEAKEETKTEDKDKNKEEDSKAKQEIAVVESSGKNSTMELKNADEFKLKILSTGGPWLQVTDDSGKVLFSGVLNEGESQEFDLTNNSSVDLNIGLATATELYINDEPVEYPISTAERVSQRIKINYTKADEAE
ncbi:helix-turn-helix domain-containing protein [Bacillus sp. AGMB 02131]|uniref:Helix-turn-helix domain-containing protein n=1 Tax=Peribacillus faecalis TaxID=2772559 RepID=A0A927HC84_9BACI|nr:RodZ family helix-turn-helix domain-containing protein [Peribacillus faecalis]MBD3109372.1 helix-turn-helix domain-containing protein [Peribacillus faecalis]